MNILFPLLAALLQAGSAVLDKVTLNVRGMNYRIYLGASYPLFLLSVVALFLIFQPSLSADMFSSRVMFLLALSTLLVFGVNIIYYRALEKDGLAELQTFELLRNIPVILFAGIFFANERNSALIGLSLLASVSIVWSHWEQHHLRIARRSFLLVIWMLTLAPFHAIVSKELFTVHHWHPLTFMLVENTLCTLLFLPFLFRYAQKISARTILLLVALNALSATAWALYYASFQLSGIVYTVLLFSLQPLLVYFAAVFFLKEKLHWKKLAAFLVTLAAIAVAQYINLD